MSACALRGWARTSSPRSTLSLGEPGKQCLTVALGRRFTLACGFVLGVGDSAARQEVSFGTSSVVYAGGWWSDPWLEPGSRARVWPPGTCVPLVVLPAACYVTLERSLHSVGGWVWLWEAGEVLSWHRVAFVTDVMAVFALSRGASLPLPGHMPCCMTAREPSLLDTVAVPQGLLPILGHGPGQPSSPSGSQLLGTLPLATWPALQGEDGGRGTSA